MEMLLLMKNLPSQITIYISLTIDIWTQRRRRTSTWFYVLWYHLHKMVGFQTNWRQKLSILLWTPSTHQKSLSESYAMHAISC